MSNSMVRLLRIMAQLRDPDSGCPWDLQQDFRSIAPYTLEEAYEVVDAIERGDLANLRDELGDLLLQVVFHARMAEEQGAFDFDDVAAAIADKLLRRHPHVFDADGTDHSDADLRQAWESHKRAERAARGTAEQGLLADIPHALPALSVAQKSGRRAATVGFDWHEPDRVIDKIHEELAELASARSSNDTDNIEEEIGDLLLAVATLARHLDVDAEQALRRANRKFAERFSKLERRVLNERGDWSEYTLEELEAGWQSVKREPPP